ncbi:MAG: hypothetical protein KatS3mg129_0526 [Leptospiraceae bacterium]|nr:MAG: hypothetical protein KatS3mg129_0526 [Leptospiraceae bacterium]
MNYLKKYKTQLIIIVGILFIGKILFSFYKFTFQLPENYLENIRKEGNYIILTYKKSKLWYQNFLEPIQKEQTLIDNLFLSKNVYNTGKINFEDILKFQPIEMKLNSDSNNITIYFYKRYFNLNVFFKLIYESFIWLLSLIFIFILVILGIYITLYLIVLINRMIRNYKLTKYITKEAP